MKLGKFSSCALWAGSVLLIGNPGIAQSRAMFPDVPPNHWAYESVKALKERGILEGYPPEPKRPGARTRTDGRPTLNTSASAPTQPESPFVDLPASHWAYAAFIDFQQRSLLEGYPMGYFSGRRLLTQYEFAIAIKRLIDREMDSPEKKLQPEQRRELLRLAQEFQTVILSLGFNTREKYIRFMRLAAPDAKR